MIARRKHRRAPTSRGFDLEARHPQRRWLAGCAGKDRYTSEAAARAGAGLHLATALDVYPCDDCAGWHLTSTRPTGQRKAPPPVQILAFICGACRARHPSIAATDGAWTPERRRAALLKLEPLAIRDGWSIGEVDDHCPSCAAELGLETIRSAA